MNAKTKIFELDIVLEEVEPLVQRGVQVPGDVSLAVLHEVVQAAVGWTNSHLHEFEIAGRRYGIPDRDDEGVADEARSTLLRLVGPRDRFTYVYDFGDGWSHQITVAGILPPEPSIRYPRCLSGEGACPPEDVGGPWGYEEFQAVLAAPAHPEHAEQLEWVGGAFDPHHFDLDVTDRALQQLSLTAGQRRAR